MARWDLIFSLSDVKILEYLNEREHVRYTELLENTIRSRSTLAKTLRDLQEKKLIQRNVKGTRPIQTYYSLTEKGKALLKHLEEIRKIVL